jgi:NAD(P)-dependent dehydrogenase (short-subunit alcohol dehydrogenase family)
MFKQGTRNVANITTSLITTPSLGHPPCRLRSTKGGLPSATKQLTIEYAASGIRVNAVPPGTIQPPMHSAESNHTLAGIHPVGRTGQIKDIVEGILFLESSSFVTSEILHIDGGQRHRPLTVWKTRCPSRQSKSPAGEPRPRQAR